MMRIGGFAKNSLIDFPKNIACVVFTQGCNFHCPYCHNPDLVAGHRKVSGLLFDDEMVFSFLKKRKGLLDGVVITGGEPTLQEDLVDFCRKVKSLGFRLKMDTNGTRPKVLESLFNENLLDYVAMDIKTGLEDYALVWQGKHDKNRIVESIDLIQANAPDYEFRTTCVKPFVTMKNMSEIGRLIKGAKHYILQNCSDKGDVLEPAFIESGNPFFSEEHMHTLQKTINEYVEKVSIR